MRRGLLEFKNVVYASFLKQHASAKDLNRAIQRAVAFVELMPKKDQHLPIQSI
jgi:hypothetical protein